MKDNILVKCVLCGEKYKLEENIILNYRCNKCMIGIIELEKDMEGVVKDDEIHEY